MQTLEDVYKEVVNSIREYENIDSYIKQNPTSIISTKLKTGDWVLLGSYALYRIILIQEHINKGKLEKVKQGAEAEILCCKKILLHYKSLISMLPKLALMLNQTYYEAHYNQGQQSAKITAFSTSAAERDYVILDNKTFTHSDKSIKDESTNPRNQETPPATALLTYKHNACPLVIGVNQDGTSAIAWHISHRSLYSERNPQEVNHPLPPNMKYLAFNLDKASLPLLPAEMINLMSGRLPDDLFTEDYFEAKVDFEYGSEGTIKSAVNLTDREPACYDSTYYPQSDTLILWGQRDDGLRCAWFMHDAIKKLSKGWHQVILGTKEQPLLYWENFLDNHYKNATQISDILAEDKLIEICANTPQQKELLAQIKQSASKHKI